MKGSCRLTHAKSCYHHLSPHLHTDRVRQSQTDADLDMTWAVFLRNYGADSRGCALYAFRLCIIDWMLLGTLELLHPSYILLGDRRCHDPHFSFQDSGLVLLQTAACVRATNPIVSGQSICRRDGHHMARVYLPHVFFWSLSRVGA